MKIVPVWAVELTRTLFHVFALSWGVFSLLEFFMTGFVSNYFNVHWLLIVAVVLGVCLLFPSLSRRV
jgi:hypothetical protein